MNDLVLESEAKVLRIKCGLNRINNIKRNYLLSKTDKEIINNFYSRYKKKKVMEDW